MAFISFSQAQWTNTFQRHCDIDFEVSQPWGHLFGPPPTHGETVNRALTPDT